MIVAMQERATEEQIDAVIDAMVDAGLNVHRTTGATQSILAGVGPTSNVDLAKFELFEGVLYVLRITAPYKLAGRAFRPEGTVVEFANGVKIGGEQVAVMAGHAPSRAASRFLRSPPASRPRARASCAGAPSSRAVPPTPFRVWGFRG